MAGPLEYRRLEKKIKRNENVNVKLEWNVKTWEEWNCVVRWWVDVEDRCSSALISLLTWVLRFEVLGDIRKETSIHKGDDDRWFDGWGDYSVLISPRFLWIFVQCVINKKKSPLIVMAKSGEVKCKQCCAFRNQSLILLKQTEIDRSTGWLWVEFS